MPEWYRARGVAVRKTIRVPEYSEALAEFIGILLGDGGIRAYQVIVSLNKSHEAEYLQYVKQLIQRLFGVTASPYVDGNDDSVNLTVSSIRLVEWLEQIGMKRGNKVAQQVDVPSWIWQATAYQRGCLRGLVDTDGCFYRHRYRVNGQFYGYPKMCFVSYAKPLFQSARRLFATFGLSPTPHKDGRRLYLHEAAGVARYMVLVGTHNPYHQSRFAAYARHIGRETIGEVAESGRLQLTANELGGHKPSPGFKSRPLRGS